MMNNALPYSVPGEIVFGTGSKLDHLQEAYHQQIITPNDMLLAFFDGILFDGDGKRVGGMALSDYLLITDTALILWARDQYKDYVDRFPLSHAFVTSYGPKDGLHAVLRLNLLMPETNLNGNLNKAEKVNVIFDMVPLPDIEIMAGMLNKLSAVLRDMKKVGAEAEAQKLAIRSIYQKEFVAQLKAKLPATPRPPSPVADFNKGMNPTAHAPVREEFSDEDLNGFVTPLDRLDRSGNLKRSAAMVSEFAPSNGTPSNDTVLHAPDGNPFNYVSDRNIPNGSVNQGAHYSGNNVPIADLPGMRRPGGIRKRRALEMDQLEMQASQKPEPLPPDAVYMITRFGRTAWDGLSKLRQEAESRARPQIQSLKDNGLNLKEITEFLSAANTLLETVGRNPAARDLALAFLNKSGGNIQLGGVPKRSNGNSPKEVEEVEGNSKPDEPPTLRPVALAGKALKVERRGSGSGKPPLIKDISKPDEETRTEADVPVYTVNPVLVEKPAEEAVTVRDVLDTVPEVEETPAVTPVEETAGNTPFGEVPEQPALMDAESSSEDPQPAPEAPLANGNKRTRLPIKRKGAVRVDSAANGTEVDIHTNGYTSNGLRTDLSIFVTGRNGGSNSENQATLLVPDGPAHN
jgi:hypothetical protein